MKKSICGIECNDCEMKDSCGGCEKNSKECVMAVCAKEKKGSCQDCSICELKESLIKEFNDLKIKDMERVTDLNALLGSFVNMEYILDNGTTIKLLSDEKIYLGNQLLKKGSNKCYGLAADKDYLLVCEYGEDGTNPQIVIYKKR